MLKKFSDNPKDMVLLLEYSDKMSYNNKINIAVENILSFFDNFVTE